MGLEVILQFLLALGIGSIIGIEREIVHRKEKIEDFAGIRNFILISLSGALIAYLSIQILSSPLIFGIGFIIFASLIIAGYVITSRKTKRITLITSLASLLTFILGSLTTITISGEFNKIIILIAIIITALLSLKEKLHKFAKKTKKNELFAGIKFAIITLVILPFLPNKNYSLTDFSFISNLFSNSPKLLTLLKQVDVFNPYIIWLMVVFIVTLSFIGYILTKSIGTKKGISITSILGGLVSSTAVTLTLSEKSKKKLISRVFVIGIVLANIIMLIRIIIEVAVVNPALLKSLIIPMSGMILVGLIGLGILILKKEKESHQEINFKNPFALLPALKFGIFFAFILVLSKTLNLLFGEKGIYFASVISGLADVDAITLSLSTLSSSGSLGMQIATAGIILAACSNIFVKAGITILFGSKKVAKKIIIIFLAMIITGLSLAFIL